jgi:putative serine protease PepD
VLITIVILVVVIVGAGTFVALKNKNGSQSLSDSSFSTLGKTSTALTPTDSTITDPNWESVAESVKPTVVSIVTSSGSFESGAEGSGMIVDAKQGLVLTNNHVVTGASKLQISLYNGAIYGGSVVGTDPTTDLAIIKIANPPSDLQQVTFADSSAVKVGEPVMAVGNPLGLDNTVTVGIISAINRPVMTQAEDDSGYYGNSNQNVVVTNALQTDTAINPGNSGGPLFNGEGQVLGVNSSIATMSQSSGQSGSIGIGFAIPSNTAKMIGEQLASKGKAQHSLLGVTMRDGSVEIGGVTRNGARIVSVVRGSAAEAAKLQENDVVIAVNGSPTNSTESLTAWVRSFAPGTTIKLTYVRNGKTVEVDVTLKQASDSK